MVLQRLSPGGLFWGLLEGADFWDDLYQGHPFCYSGDERG